MQGAILELRTELKDIKTSRQTRGSGTNNNALQRVSEPQSEVSSAGEETVWAAVGRNGNKPAKLESIHPRVSQFD